MSEDEESTETSLCSAYCVVYILENQEWKVTGKGWSQVHVYQDKEDGSHRIVGWTVINFEVVINANVTPACKYKKKSDDFHKFTDEENNTYGFGFYKQKESSYEDSQNFMKTILSVLNPGGVKATAASNSGDKPGVQRQVSTDAPPRTGRGGSIMANIRTSLGAGPAVQEDVSKHTHLALGDLKISSPKMKGEGDSSIGVPQFVKHTNHVTYNPTTRKYEGLPKDWETVLKRQFGLDPSQVETADVVGYKSRIPAVLVQMRDYLRKEGAFEIEGLFRIAADGDECVYVKKALNDNTFTSCEDIHCISSLIKMWFRELPKALLDPISPNRIDACVSEADAGAIVELLPEPQSSIFLWLIDLCVEVSSYSKVNKMTGKNLAIVIGPNLFKPSMEDPMASLRFSQKVANFMHKAITWREQYLASSPNGEARPTFA